MSLQPNGPDQYSKKHARLVLLPPLGGSVISVARPCNPPANVSVPRLTDSFRIRGSLIQTGNAFDAGTSDRRGRREGVQGSQGCRPSASERRGNTSKGLKDLCLRGKARSYLCHIRSTAAAHYAPGSTMGDLFPLCMLRTNPATLQTNSPRTCYTFEDISVRHISQEHRRPCRIDAPGQYHVRIIRAFPCRKLAHKEDPVNPI